MTDFSLGLENEKDGVLRSIGEEEREAFNNFIQGHPYGSVFQSYEWGELKKKHGWLPVRLVLERSGNLAGAVTLLHKGNTFCRMAYSPRGPVVDFSDGEALTLLTGAMRGYLQHRKVGFWKLDPEVPSRESYPKVFRLQFTPASTRTGFGGIQPRTVWRLDMGEAPDMEKGLGKSARRQIKKAEKNGVVLRPGTREDLPAFYGLLQETARRNRFRIRPLTYYHDMWDTLEPPGFLCLFLGTREGRVVCGALATPFGRGVWDLYAGTGPEARQTGASYLLTWEMVKWAARQGYSFYDLGGVPLGEKGESPLQGLTDFKSRFGGGPLEFVGEYDLVHSPLQYRLWRLGMGAREKLLKRITH